MPALLNFFLVLLGVGAAAAGGGGGSSGSAAPAPSNAGQTAGPLVIDEEEDEEEEEDTPPQDPPQEPEEDSPAPLPEAGPSGAPDLPNSAYALGWAGLTAEEQYMLELVNRARLDPEAEEVRTGELVDVDLSTAPKQALAVDPILSAAADNHSADMLARDFFDHENPDGDGPTDRAQDEGWTGRGVWENISARWTSSETIWDEQSWLDASHAGLWKSDGHQFGMLQPGHTVVGIGVDTGRPWEYPDPDPRVEAWTAMVVTEKFSNDGQTYLTGVVFDDGDDDDFYDIGEGQGGVKITVWNDDETYATSTWDAGGYSVALDQGTYTVRFEGGDLEAAYETEVVIGNQNVKLDVNEDHFGVVSAGMVPDAPSAEDVDPIDALFLSADASREAIDREIATADQFAEMADEDLLEFV